jgi:hypothetical protein
VVVRARARVAAAGKQPWFIGLGASIGLEASRRRSVTVKASSVEASKGRLIVGGWALAASMAAPQTTFGRR